LESSAFNAELDRRLHGRFQIDGASQLAVDSVDPMRRAGVSSHEHVHAELSDNSTYGFFQRWLLFVTQVANGDLLTRAREVLDLSFAATQRTHEGFASLREYAWVYANEGADAASLYLEGLPAVYREGLQESKALVGDPATEPYDGTNAQGYHITLAAIGLFIMNSPIISAYSHPDCLFNDELPWIGVNGPDERLHALAGYADVIYRRIRRWRPIAELWFPGNGIDALTAMWGQIADELEEVVPAWKVVARADAIAQTAALKAAWMPHLGPKAANAQDLGPRDVTRQRALEREHERMNAGPHQGSDVASTRVTLDSFVNLAQLAKPDDVLYLLVLSMIPGDLPVEFLPDCNMGVVSFPMWTASASNASPLVRFMPSWTCVTPIAELLTRSADLAAAGCLWYSSGLIRIMHERELSLEGAMIERCTSAMQLLRVATATADAGVAVTYCDFNYEEAEIAYEYVLVVSSPSTLSFTIADHVSMEAFAEVANEQGISRAEETATITVGRRDVLLRQLARIARWGLVGS
jgi:hypothetical protein